MMAVHRLSNLAHHSHDEAKKFAEGVAQFKEESDKEKMEVSVVFFLSRLSDAINIE
jgi:hypothetical protein